MTDAFTLTPLGTGTAWTTADHAQSGYLLDMGGRRICIDLGAGALAQMMSHVNPGELDLIAITHAHPDHCIDLFALHVYLAHGPGAGRRIPLHTPPGLRSRFKGFGGVDHWEEVFAESEMPPPTGEREVLPGITLSWQEVPHLEHTFALRVDHAGRSVCFGADCGPNAELGPFAAGVDLLILECSFGLGPVPDGVPHLDAASVIEIAREARPRELWLTHCYPGHDRIAVRDAVAAGLDCPVAWAAEGPPLGPVAA